MSQPIVLVIFYSRCGSTEKAALAAAVGAVQSRGLIRLRRMADSGEFPDCQDTLERMRKEYVPPTETDILGADAIMLAVPPDFRTSSQEWKPYFEMLRRLNTERKLDGKIGAVLDTGSEDAFLEFSGTMTRLGLLVVPPDFSHSVDGATSHGRRVVAVTRALSALSERKA